MLAPNLEWDIKAYVWPPNLEWEVGNSFMGLRTAHAMAAGIEKGKFWHHISGFLDERWLSLREAMNDLIPLSLLYLPHVLSQAGFTFLIEKKMDHIFFEKGGGKNINIIAKSFDNSLYLEIVTNQTTSQSFEFL